MPAALKFEYPAQSVLDRAEVGRGEPSLAAGQAALVDGADLIAHRHRTCPGRGYGNDERRAWLRSAGKRDDDDRAPRPVERIGGHNDRRPDLPDLRAACRIEIHPPDFRRDGRPPDAHRPSSAGTRCYRSGTSPSSMKAPSHSAISAANASSLSTSSATR